MTSEHQRYATALSTFRDKYFALPGDFSSATKFWTAAGTCPGTNATPSTTTATCDGNGNGLVEPAIATSNEVFRFWQHLANAGLIEGTYTGVANSATAADTYALVGTNVPRSKISNAGWSALYVGPITFTSTNWFEGNYGNVFYIGLGQATGYSNQPFLKAEEAWNIDTKMDDGRPGLGSLLTFEAFTNCHDAGTSNAANLSGTANYALSNSAVGCGMIFKMNM